MFQPGHGYGSHISSTRSLWVRPPPFVPASLDPIHPIRPSTGSETVLGHHPLRPAAHRQRWWDEAGRPRGADRRGEEQRSRRVWARVTGVEAVFRWVEGWEMLGGFRRLGKHNDAGKVQSTDMLEQHPALAVVHIYTYIYIIIWPSWTGPPRAQRRRARCVFACTCPNPPSPWHNTTLSMMKRTSDP